jgi:hypothetical protein
MRSTEPPGSAALRLRFKNCTGCIGYPVRLEPTAGGLGDDPSSSCGPRSARWVFETLRVMDALGSRSRCPRKEA